MTDRSRVSFLYRFALVIALLLIACGPGHAQETMTCKMADGFDFPVGKPDATGYYKARGYRPNGHLGEDWNGGPGDSDLGLPVYSIADGIVVLARDVRLGWGNKIIVRHAYVENGKVCFVDSVYAHLQRILVREGTRVARGSQIGTIGNSGGRYDAHLHFELRKEIRIGIYRSMYPQDDRAYWDPTTFIQRHRRVVAIPLIANIPVNTFGPPGAGTTPLPMQTPGGLRIPGRAQGQPSTITQPKNPATWGTFKVKRYDDLWGE